MCKCLACTNWRKGYTLMMNDYNWHLQGMIASFDLTSYCYRGNLEVVATLLKLYNYTLQFILYGPNRGLWFILRQFCYIRYRLFNNALLIFWLPLRNVHKICRSSKGLWCLKIWPWNPKNFKYLENLCVYGTLIVNIECQQYPFETFSLSL